jgi:hypothetical protein
VVTAPYLTAEPDVAGLTARLDALLKDTTIASGEIRKAVDPTGTPVSRRNGYAAATRTSRVHGPLKRCGTGQPRNWLSACRAS